LQHTCLRAERAALLARQGRLEEARKELAAIHAVYDRQPNAVVSAWVSLAEGLVAFYGDLSTSARDKMLRSLALGTAVGEQSIRSLSAAWLAHMNYLEQDFEPMVRNLNIALNRGHSISSSAVARASLVAAQAFHWANRFDLAQPWYSKARHCATSDGDQTMLSALMHNMAWLRAAQARRLAVSGVTNPDQVRQVLLGAESTDHFDKRVGTASLRSLVPMLRAHVLTMLDRFPEAIELFDTHLLAALSEGLGRLQCGVLSEIAWCRVNTGDIAGARREATEAQKRLVDCLQLDERAATHGRLAQVFVLLNEPDAAEHHQERAAIDWLLHTEHQERLIALMSSEFDVADRCFLGPRSSPKL
jgi:hypothetical protein